METLTVPLDHKITIKLIDKATGKVVDTSETTAELLGAHYTVTCVMWNAHAVTGGVQWRHPGTGELYPRGLAFKCETLHPDTGETLEVSIR